MAAFRASPRQRLPLQRYRSVGRAPLTFPADLPRLFAGPFTQSSAWARHTETVKILVVDDEPAVRDSLERALRLEGYEIDLAADGAQALAAHGRRRARRRRARRDDAARRRPRGVPPDAVDGRPHAGADADRARHRVRPRRRPRCRRRRLRREAVRARRAARPAARAAAPLRRRGRRARRCTSPTSSSTRSRTR